MAKGKKTTLKVTKKASKKKEPVEPFEKKVDSAATILDFYKSNKLKPAAFLSNLSKNQNGGLGSTENQAAKKEVLEKISVLDKDFSKTLSLVHKSRTHLKGKYKIGCARLAGEIVLQQLSKKGLGAVDDEAESIEILKQLCGSTSDGIKKKSTQKQSLNIVAVAILWLDQLKNLELKTGFHQLETFVSRGKGKTKKNTLPGNVGQQAIEIITKPPVTMANLEKYFLFIKPWKNQVNTLNTLLENLTEKIGDEKSRGAELLQKVGDLEEKLDDLQIEFGREKDASIAKEQRLEGERANLKCDLDQIKSRISSVLTGRIKKSIGGALEAVELNPPRTQFLIQELDAISVAIEEEVRWLRSLD